jgi:hypothetical protein
MAAALLNVIHRTRDAAHRGASSRSPKPPEHVHHEAPLLRIRPHRAECPDGFLPLHVASALLIGLADQPLDRNVSLSGDADEDSRSRNCLPPFVANDHVPVHTDPLGEVALGHAQSPAGRSGFGGRGRAQRGSRLPP